MCLADVTGKPKKETGLGWKVFADVDGELHPENRGYEDYKYNVWYNAGTRADKFTRTVTLKTEWDGRDGNYIHQEYHNGFHVALRREDARAFVKNYRTLRTLVVRQVEYSGAHTLGNGGLYFPGPQVIVNEIRILRPRAGGSAYARKTKVAIVPAPGTVLAVA